MSDEGSAEWVTEREHLLAAADRDVGDSGVSKPSWTDLEEALTSLASEDYIARRLESLRGQAGLSQEQLAKRLETFGVQMPQSSISKIETPMRTGRGKRRDITVDEALALAKALNVSLTRLLLPDDALTDLQLHRIIEDGFRLWRDLGTAQTQYESAVDQLVQAARTRPVWRQRLVNLLERLRLLEEMRDEEGNYVPGPPHPSVSTIGTRVFLEDVVSRIDAVDSGDTVESS